MTCKPDPLRGYESRRRDHAQVALVELRLLGPERRRGRSRLDGGDTGVGVEDGHARRHAGARCPLAVPQAIFIDKVGVLGIEGACVGEVVSRAWVRVVYSTTSRRTGGCRLGGGDDGLHEERCSSAEARRIGGQIALCDYRDGVRWGVLGPCRGVVGGDRNRRRVDGQLLHRSRRCGGAGTSSTGAPGSSACICGIRDRPIEKIFLVWGTSSGVQVGYCLTESLIRHLLVRHGCGQG